MTRILVVDDDHAYRGILVDYLSREYEVFQTASAENALVLALEEQPEAILMDLSLPGMSGFELCQTLSSLSYTQHIPIFVITGQDERNRTFCRNLGATRFFTKPVNLTQLKAELAQVLSAKVPERRQERRIQLQLPLTLRVPGAACEFHATTENVSNGGFLCVCDSLPEGFEDCAVYLRGKGEQRLGDARLVRVVPPDNVDSRRRYGFQFTALLPNSLLPPTAQISPG